MVTNRDTRSKRSPPNALTEEVVRVGLEAMRQELKAELTAELKEELGLTCRRPVDLKRYPEKFNMYEGVKKVSKGKTLSKGKKVVRMVKSAHPGCPPLFRDNGRGCCKPNLKALLRVQRVASKGIKRIDYKKDVPQLVGALGARKVANLQKGANVQHDRLVKDVSSHGDERIITVYNGLVEIIGKAPHLLGKTLLDLFQSSGIMATKVGKAGMWVASSRLGVAVGTGLVFISWGLPTATTALAVQKATSWVVNFPAVQRVIMALSYLMMKYYCIKSGELQKVLDRKQMKKEEARKTLLGALVHNPYIDPYVGAAKEWYQMQKFNIASQMQEYSNQVSEAVTSTFSNGMGAAAASAGVVAAAPAFAPILALVGALGPYAVQMGLHVQGEKMKQDALWRLFGPDRCESYENDEMSWRYFFMHLGAAGLAPGTMLVAMKNFYTNVKKDDITKYTLT